MHKLIRKLKSIISNIKRVMDYIPLVWNHRNWDYGFIFKFNTKLHEDLYKGCYEEGHHLYTKSQARKLKTVIELYKRLHQDNYDHWHYEYINKKYGKSEYYTKKIPNPIGNSTGYVYVMGSTRDDNMSEAQKKAYLEDRKRMSEREDWQRMEDLKMLGKYITKYSRQWWD